MERFLCDSHRGAAVLAGFRTKGRGRQMFTDFTHTVGGVSSATFLVSPGAPSDRERMILSWSSPDHCIYEYRNALTAEAPPWCLANNPVLHAFVVRRLERAGLHERTRFSLSPVEGAGEMVAFKYTGGVPKHVVFPIGSETINWLTMVRSAMEMGSILSKHAGVKPLLGGTYKRARIWRSLDFVEEACQRAGMLHYNPLSVGTVRFGSEVLQTHVKTRHDHNLLFLGDSFSKESILFADIVVGGRTSDFWAALSAVVKYKRLDGGSETWINKHSRVPKTAAVENDDEWCEMLLQSTDSSGYRHHHNHHHQRCTGEDILLNAINEHVSAGSKRESVLAFVRTVLTPQQRDTMGNLNNLPASRAGLADAVLYAPARILTWTLMHSLLSIIKFNILHLLGYEAHRTLVFKLLIPALIAIFLRDSCLTDTFGHAALNLQLLREKAGGQTLANILNRTPIPAPCATTVGTREFSSVPMSPRNYCQYDPASLSGELNASASIPFAVNMGSVANKLATDLDVLQVLVCHTIKVFDAKNKAAADNRDLRRSALVAESRRSVGKKRQRQSDSDGDDNDDNDDNDNLYGGRVPRREVPYVTVENEQRKSTIRAIQEKLTARYNSIYSDDRVTDVAFACSTIKAIMNTLETAFRLTRGTILDSVHLNARTGEGVWKVSDEQTTLDAMMRDADIAENKNPLDSGGFDLSNPGHMAKRFNELCLDPPTVHAVKDSTVAERVLQNELMVTTLALNPIFTSLYQAEGLLQRVVILTNIVKYMNAVTVCLVDGDLPTLVETRKGVKRLMTKGDKADFDYRKAGTTPVGTLRSQLLPPCIAGLKSIAARGKQRQTCRHAFCRSLRFLFFSLDPESAHVSLSDPASDASLLALADFCSQPSCDGGGGWGWHDRLIRPVIEGAEEWTVGGRYSPLPSEGDRDGRGPRDFFHAIRTAFVDEDVILSTDDGGGSSNIDHWQEMLQLRAEGNRRESFVTDRLVSAAEVDKNTWRTKASKEIILDENDEEEEDPTDRINLNDLEKVILGGGEKLVYPSASF